MTQEKSSGNTRRPGPIRGSIYGLQAIAQAMDGLGFPASKEHVLAHVDAQTLSYDGQEFSLRELIAESDKENFESLAVLNGVVSQALERRGITSMDGQKGTIHH